METRSISFPDHRISGLQKELFNRLHNGGLNTAQLQILLRGGNPNDYATWRVQEWLNFFSDVFDINHFNLDGYWHDYNFDRSGCRFQVEHGSALVFYPKHHEVPLHLIIDKWNEKVPASMVISAERISAVEMSSLDEKWKSFYGFHNYWIQALKTPEDELLCLKQDAKGIPVGRSLRYTLLHLMFLYWKHGEINLAKDFMWDREDKKKRISRKNTYIFSCGHSIFPGAVDENNPCFPFVVLEGNKRISIHVRGSEELLSLYKPGSLIALY